MKYNNEEIKYQNYQQYLRRYQSLQSSSIDKVLFRRTIFHVIYEAIEKVSQVEVEAQYVFARN